jgi:hypothetical protein
LDFLALVDAEFEHPAEVLLVADVRLLEILFGESAEHVAVMGGFQIGGPSAPVVVFLESENRGSGNEEVDPVAVFFLELFGDHDTEESLVPDIGRRVDEGGKLGRAQGDLPDEFPFHAEFEILRRIRGTPVEVARDVLLRPERERGSLGRADSHVFEVLRVKRIGPVEVGVGVVEPSEFADLPHERPGVFVVKKKEELSDSSENGEPVSGTDW